MRKDLYVSDLLKTGAASRFESVFQVHQKDLRKKKNGGAYLALRLGDRTGWLDARVWDNAEATATAISEKDFVHVRGRTHQYNGTCQIIVHRLKSVSVANVDPGQFLACTDRDVGQMYREVLAAIQSFRNPHLKRLLENIFHDPDIKVRFQRAPAASGMHHAKVGGLLEHVLSCLGMAHLVASHYQEIDGDLLATGVLLHDFGKIFEMSAERAIEYTDEGRLLGHIAMGSSWIGQRCDQIEGFSPRLKTLVLHMVLSHHGKLEFGSPREPLFPEALALHYIDDLDSRMDMMRQVTAQISGGVWSRRHRGLGRSVLDRAAFLSGEGTSSAAIQATEEDPLARTSHASDAGYPKPRKHNHVPLPPPRQPVSSRSAAQPISLGEKSDATSMQPQLGLPPERVTSEGRAE